MRGNTRKWHVSGANMHTLGTIVWCCLQALYKCCFARQMHHLRAGLLTMSAPRRTVMRIGQRNCNLQLHQLAYCVQLACLPITNLATNNNAGLPLSANAIPLEILFVRAALRSPLLRIVQAEWFASKEEGRVIVTWPRPARLRPSSAAHALRRKPF